MDTVKIRDDGLVGNKAVYLALGVRRDGTREILGIWIENTEGAKFWLKVFNELRNRGVSDILIAVTDGLAGMPAALEAAFRLSGLALLHSGPVYRIVPLTEAARQSGLVESRRGPARPGFGVEIVPLHYIGAAEMQRTLEPLGLALKAGVWYVVAQAPAKGAGRPRTAATLTAMLRACGFGEVRQMATATPLLTSVLVARPA